MPLKSIKCGFCQSEISLDSHVGGVVTCTHCCGSFKIEDLRKKANQKKLTVRLAGAVFVSGLIAGKVLGLFDSAELKMQKSVAQMNLQQALAKKDQCLETADRACLQVIYKRLITLAPTDTAFKANYAFLLTESQQHKEALPIYEQIIASGEGTYDLMAYYGRSLDALGETAKAIDWFQNSLSINPNLLDITQQLAVTMVKDKRHYEAASLLDSFISKFPESEGTLKGNLISIKSQMKQDMNLVPAESLKLLTIRGSHYFLPLVMGQDKQLHSFMVDTGASNLVMTTETISKLFPASLRTARAIKISLADGRIENAYLTILPEVQVGPWKVKNVETVFCAKCANLAGRSLLSKFAMKTMPKGELEILEIALARN